MPTNAYSAADTQALVAEINVAALPADLKKLFCEGWPGAKTVLQTLQNLLKNPLAKAAIGIVIAAGDAVSSAICR